MLTEAFRIEDTYEMLMTEGFRILTKYDFADRRVSILNHHETSLTEEFRIRKNQNIITLIKTQQVKQHICWGHVLSKDWTQQIIEINKRTRSLGTGLDLKKNRTGF